MADPDPDLTPFGPSPLRSAMKTDEDDARTPPASGTLKAVQIEEPVPESRIDSEQQPATRQFRAGSTGRRLSGRLPPFQLGGVSTRSSISEGSPALRPVDDSPQSSSNQSQHQHQHRHQYYSEKLLAQVGEWLEQERNKLGAKAKLKKHHHHRHKASSPPPEQEGDHEAEASNTGLHRTDSIDSQSSDIALDKLQRILENSMASLGLSSLPQHSPRVTRSRRRAGSRSSMLQRTASSDTDYIDGDAVVPSCDAWLDNSKTLGYSGGGASSTDDLAKTTSRSEKDREAWLQFKNEIIRITHTLKLKGWRRVALGSGDDIDVMRLSGALTNAVYVVTPPTDMDKIEGKKAPPKILLRIYGPQVEHLIDRENELMVLGRLARKKIGPRLLGTFKNGRFEQFFNAITLTPSHLREPETSRQIAKRMRELHDGIDLLPRERENGPGVWRNWDQWLDNVARIITFLDKQVENTAQQTLRRNSVIHAWKSQGYVCGVPWAQFRDTVNKYRKYLNSRYKDKRAIHDRLVFAHNDTQYGNILRVRPDDEKSPLLQPANKHKQLIVIDFEYAAANTCGLEFANHFTEWTYNYHDPVASHACNTGRYPTPEEQRRFIKAYVDHRPQFPHASSTPRMTPYDSSSSSVVNTPALLPTASSSSIVDFMLDARVPPPGGWSAEERARDEQSDEQVRELMDQTRLWRPANSAMWVAWGIVQAKVPGLDNGDATLEADEEDDVDEFDYLSYAQDRALFFWGDCVQLGLVKAEDLPEPLKARLKIVEH